MSDKIKRFHYMEGFYHCDPDYIIEKDDGEYCWYEDYERLLTESRSRESLLCDQIDARDKDIEHLERANDFQRHVIEALRRENAAFRENCRQVDIEYSMWQLYPQAGSAGECKYESCSKHRWVGLDGCPFCKTEQP